MFFYHTPTVQSTKASVTPIGASFNKQHVTNMGPSPPTAQSAKAPLKRLTPIGASSSKQPVHNMPYMDQSLWSKTTTTKLSIKKNIAIIYLEFFKNLQVRQIWKKCSHQKDAQGIFRFWGFTNDFEAYQPWSLKITKNIKRFSLGKAQTPKNVRLRRAILKLSNIQ